MQMQFQYYDPLLAIPDADCMRAMTNREYRAVLRQAFRMKRSQNTFIDVNNDPPLDDETADELDMDENALRDGLDEIYTLTISNTDMRHLFTMAAACMFSEDLGTGVAVLLAFDYFPYFHTLLQHIATTGSFVDIVDHSSYNWLITRFSN